MLRNHFSSHFFLHGKVTHWLLAPELILQHYKIMAAPDFQLSLLCTSDLVPQPRFTRD